MAGGIGVAHADFPLDLENDGLAFGSAGASRRDGDEDLPFDPLQVSARRGPGLRPQFGPERGMHRHPDRADTEIGNNECSRGVAAGASCSIRRSPAFSFPVRAPCSKRPAGASRRTAHQTPKRPCNTGRGPVSQRRYSCPRGRSARRPGEGLQRFRSTRRSGNSRARPIRPCRDSLLNYQPRKPMICLPSGRLRTPIGGDCTPPRGGCQALTT